MNTNKYKIIFGNLKVGAKFSLSETNGALENIKVPESKVNGKVGDTFGTFNVICLDDGRPRFFNDKELVYTTSIK